METLTTEDRYKILCARFEMSKEFVWARRLWLFCYDYDLEMPHEALAYLAEGLRKADSDWYDSLKEGENKRSILMFDVCDLHDFVTRRSEVISKESAIQEWADNNAIEFENARSCYYRFHKKIKAQKSRFRK